MLKCKHKFIEWSFLVKVLLIAIIQFCLFNNRLFSQTPYLVDEQFNSGIPANWTNSGTTNINTNWARNADARSFTALGNSLTLNTNLSSNPGEIYFTSKTPAGSSFSTLLIEESINGTTWTTVGSFSPNGTTSVFKGNLLATTRRVRISLSVYNKNITLDDVRITKQNFCANRSPNIVAIIVDGGCDVSDQCENDNETIIFFNGNRNLHLDSLEIIMPNGTNATSSGYSFGGNGLGNGVSTWTTNSTYTSFLNTTAACSSTLFFDVPASRIIPPNARVYAFTGLNPTAAYNFSTACNTAPVYVIYSTETACAGAATTSSGKYPNAACPGGSPGCDRSTAIFNHGSGCSDIKTYTKSNGATSNGSMIFFNPSSSVFTSSCNKFTPLPIELLDFYATKNNKANDIFWKVAQEEHILYYTVEKSNDAVHFTQLATVYATNEMQTKSYSVVDDEPFSDITYYRLSTKETNGLTKDYTIISVEEKDTKWQYIYYKTETNLVLEFKNSLPKNSTINLYDLNGKIVLTESINQSKTAINIQHLASGIYFAQLVTPYKIENFKIINLNNN